MSGVVHQGFCRKQVESWLPVYGSSCTCGAEGRHAAPTEPTAVERLTATALATGRSALEKFGPEAAVAAMAGWLPAIERAQRKEARR